jgi:molybdopterin-binding protein
MIKPVISAGSQSGEVLIRIIAAGIITSLILRNATAEMSLDDLRHDVF